MSATVNATIPPTPSSGVIPSDLSSLITFIQTFSELSDWFKLALIGIVLETCRRLSSDVFYKVIDHFWISASFENDDRAYFWMMFWVSRLPQFRDVREFTITTTTFGMDTDVEDDDDDDDNPNAVMIKRKSRRVKCIPAYSAKYNIRYRGHWVSVKRIREENHQGWGQEKATLYIHILTRNRAILDTLVQEARALYVASRVEKIDIFVATEGYANDWRSVASRSRRPLSSIILDPGVKERVLGDAKEFLQSKKWYTSRGIPYRRGYLLYGPPGSGKTSLVHSLAGELLLDIYIISLSKIGMDDSTLNNLLCNLPEHCIALIEDIDAAFTNSLNRGMDDSESRKNDEEEDDPALTLKQIARKPGQRKVAPTPASRITLSGLLNALDGVSAQEGRLLFATTNRLDVLDPALIRPGRMDLHVEFQLASRFQAREIFRQFYLPDHDGIGADVNDDEKVVDEESVDSGYSTSSKGSKTTTPPTAQLIDTSDVLSTSPGTLPDASPTSPPPHYRGSTLSRKRVEKLATEFASKAPDRELAMASLQGYLMKYKVAPVQAVEEFEAWVEEKREAKKRKEEQSTVRGGDGPVAASVQGESSREKH